MADGDGPRSDGPKVVERIGTCAEIIERLKDKILANPDAPLPEGEWKVRDAVSHLAARANPIPLLHKRISEMNSDSEPLSTDEANHLQVEDRKGASIEELIQECEEGFAAAQADMPNISVEDLSQKVKFGDGEMYAVDIMYYGGPRHFMDHLNDIEKALEDK